MQVFAVKEAYVNGRQSNAMQGRIKKKKKDEERLPMKKNIFYMRWRGSGGNVSPL